VKSQVLEQDDLAVLGIRNSLLNLFADTVLGQDNLLAELRLELGHDGGEGVLGVGLAIGAAQVGHEDDAFCAVIDGVFDGGDGADDALVVGDFLVGVEGDVEVDLGVMFSIYSRVDGG